MLSYSFKKFRVNYSINFYSVAGVESILLAAYTFYVLTSHHFENEGTFANSTNACIQCESDEYLWRIVATSIAVPLIIEYLLDFVVSFLYPTVSQDNKHHVLEDRLGHGIIVASLLSVSYLPMWIFGQWVCNYRDAFVSFGHSMIVCGVLGKLETFSSDIWHQSDAIIVLTLFFGAQASLLSDIRVVSGIVPVHYKLGLR